MNGNNATASKHNLAQHTHDSVIKVAILGAESTGKTTLCRDLAEHYKSLWVPEYMRQYLQAKWNNEQATCTWDDLLPIAQGQIELENKLAQPLAQNIDNEQSSLNSKHYLFCDTSLFELMIYANWYYGDCPSELTQAALAHHYDLVLLTDVDIPWIADDLRDSPYDRQAIISRIKNELNYYNKPFKCIGGDRQQRVSRVANWLNKMQLF